MEKIAILTDSACDLPAHLIEKFKIHVLPLKVIYGDKCYSDRVDIQPAEVYARMPDEIPTTSMPSPEEIHTALKRIKADGFSHVIAIHLSSALSGTCANVHHAAKEIDNIIIKVFDSKTLSFGTGWIVLDTARRIANGLSFNHIWEHIQHLPDKIDVFYVVETLEYLRRGGRIGKVAGMLGHILHLRPIISVDANGEYYTYAKTRGYKKSIEKLVEIVGNTVQQKRINLAVLNGGANEECNKLVARLSSLPNINELIQIDITPSLVVHTGPGSLGIATFEI